MSSLILELEDNGATCSVLASGCELDLVADMTLHPNGNLLVANFRGNSVVQFDTTTGTCLGDFIPPGFGGLMRPEGIAVGPNGNIFVASRETNQVLEYDPDGSLIGPFAEGGGLDFPMYIVFTTVFLDCNENGILDARDISTETSTDSDTNEIPDECETDSNFDGIPDACED